MQAFKKLIKSERLALTATLMPEWVRRMFGKGVRQQTSCCLCCVVAPQDESTILIRSEPLGSDLHNLKRL